MSVKNKRWVMVVVDDSEVSLMLIRSIFEETGRFRVVTVNDSRKALPVIQMVHPDLILLDLMMPEVSGTDILYHLKSDPEIAHIPVVIVSAHGTEPEVDHVMALGAAGFVHKPIGVNHLMEKINGILEKFVMSGT